MRKIISAIPTNTSVTPGGERKTMILSTIMGGTGKVTTGSIGYVSANGTIGASGLVSSDDPSDPSKNLTNLAFVVAVPGRVQKAHYSGTLPTLVETYTITLMKNGVATNIVINVTAATHDGNGNGVAQDVTHTVNVSAGDLLAWEFDISAGAVDCAGSVSAYLLPN